MGVFKDHYLRNSWGHPESVSGSGSTIEATQVVRRVLPEIVENYRIRSVVDAPCGDFNWMRMLDLPVEYIGCDVVPELVEINTANFARPGRSFAVLDITSDSLPAADLIICRDCLFHFSFVDIQRALRTIKASKSKYLLTTSYPNLKRNRNIPTGDYRRLNLQIAPFSFPPPILLIHENDPEGSDKSLGLWKIADL